ncbi:hypothetical protein ACP70R_014715 [Stipagrostis hirtigluma subsp. patula]
MAASASSNPAAVTAVLLLVALAVVVSAGSAPAPEPLLATTRRPSQLVHGGRCTPRCRRVCGKGVEEPGLPTGHYYDDIEDDPWCCRCCPGRARCHTPPAPAGHRGPPPAPAGRRGPPPAPTDRRVPRRTGIRSRPVE